MTCQHCGQETVRLVIHGQELWGPCCLPRDPRAHTVVGDDIPGGEVLKHLDLTNPDGSPQRFYSKRAMEQAARAAGWEPHVQHVGGPHTSRWI